ncbi:MAG: ERCC4 domain-containing protein [Inconstantimicrobium porci]|uniref:ERCC4 domain-containing protein n=1 Tax=Inconstantimicrobium porci TaxID=2652291 RepID=UPI002A914410|nr:ERCC4 domain-containing protein [Inconstantimicrobium porci]MDY5910610.1 ERCC4 domain-containing protein [Inconstantimicrobium porci]
MSKIRYKFKDKEIANIRKNLVVLIDTREQRNEHIKEFFEKKNINFKIHKLDYGDYSIMIPKNAIEGLTRDVYFDRDIVIERKASIDELVGNLKDDATRIRTELAHINKYNIKCYLFVEDYLFDKHIREGNDRSQYTPKTLYKRLKKQIEARYSTLIRPVHKDYIASEIYNTLEAFVYEKLKHEGWIEGDDYIGE